MKNKTCVKYLNKKYTMVNLLLIIGFVILSNLATAAITDNQVLYLAFENNILDSDDGNHNAQAAGIGTEYSFTEGIIGQCIDFNNGMTITIPDFTELDDSVTNITIAYWVKRDDITKSEEYIMYKPSYNSIIDTGENGEFSFYLRDNNSHELTLTTTGDAAENTNWHHLCFTHDGATLKLYLDGVEIDSNTPAIWSGIVYNSMLPLNLGDACDLKMDEFRIFNRVLSEEEIDELSLTTPTPTQTQTQTQTNTITITPTFTITPTPTKQKWLRFLPTPVPNINIRNTPTPRPFKNPWARKH